MQLHVFTGAVLAFSLAGSLCMAQSAQPSAPEAQGSPSAASGEPHFPPVQQSNFTAPAPTRAEVEAFLKTSWGYDPNRVWEVFGIEKTAAPGVSKVTVLVAEKQAGQQIASLAFFVTPDGHHLISQSSVLDFGPHPYAGNYRILQQEANGPSRGATDKRFELVEFADFQCPHCKEAEPVAEKLVQDFPQARLVFQPFPLSQSHPYAQRAAAEGLCVRKEKGDLAFFSYAQALYDKQTDLTQQGAAGALASAATAAGADAARAATCADTPAIKDAVSASYNLGIKVGVDQAPMLAVNGHLLPVASFQYDTLKRIVAFQGKEDGLDIHEQPTLTNLK